MSLLNAGEPPAPPLDHPSLYARDIILDEDLRMRFQKFSFGSIRIDGTTYEHDVVIDRGEVRKRKKRPSKKFREAFGHTPISPKGSNCTKGHALRLGHATATNGICSEVQSIMYESASP